MSVNTESEGAYIPASICAKAACVIPTREANSVWVIPDSSRACLIRSLIIESVLSSAFPLALQFGSDRSDHQEAEVAEVQSRRQMLQQDSESVHTRIRTRPEAVFRHAQEALAITSLAHRLHRNPRELSDCSGT